MDLNKHDIEESMKNMQDQACTSLTEILVKYSPELGNATKIKEALMAATDTSTEQKRIFSAFESIGDYLHRHSFPVEIKEIGDNWAQAFEEFSSLITGEKELPGAKEMQAEGVFPPLQTTIGISPKTYEIFYAAGRDLYTHKSYEKAADVFFVLAMLNHCYSNVWISLGLSEQHCGHFEQALKAFAMGAITHVDSPEPFFCAADCCIAMNDYSEAKIYLDEGLERLNKDRQYETFRGIANRIARQLKR